MTNNIITILFDLAQQAGVDVCINPDDGNVYAIEERSGSVARLHPIDEPGQTVVCFSPERLITSQTPDKETALERLIIGLKSENIGSETERNRNEIGSETERNRNEIGFIMDAQQDTIGAGKTNLRRFSDVCPVEVADIAAAVEKLLDAAIARTNKPQTIEKLMKLHAAATKFANEGNIYKLNQIAVKLRGIVKRQRGIKTSAETLRRRAARRKTLVKIAVVIVVGAALFGWGWVKLQPAPTVATPATTADHDAACDTISPAPTPLTLAFVEFEKETGKKVWPAGRACIEKTAQKYGIIDDKDAIKELITKSVK